MGSHVIIALVFVLTIGASSAWTTVLENPTPPTTAADAMKEVERFAFWNNCQPLDLFVLYASPADNVLIAPQYREYPTHKTLETTLQRRLRAARIYRESASYAGRLFIKIEPLIETKLGFLVGDEPLASPHSFATISLTFLKELTDPLTALSGIRATWRHEGWVPAERLSEKVSEMVDFFINNYLRVNESACQER